MAAGWDSQRRILYKNSAFLAGGVLHRTHTVYSPPVGAQWADGEGRAVQGKPVTFLFTDNQIANEGFVEDINNVLNTGEVLRR